MKIKNTLKLLLITSPVYFSHVINAADTGYYQNFSTYQSENNQQYQPVQQMQRMPQQAQNINYQNDYQNSAANYYNPQSQQQTQGSQIVRVSNIKTGAHVVLGGTVVANKEIVLSAQISGRVDYVAGSEGDWFNAGQVLVALNHDNILAQRDQAMANLYRTEASLGNAKVNYTKEYWAPQAYRDFNNQQAKLNTNSMVSSMGYFPSMFEKFFSMGGMPGGMPASSNFLYPNTNLNPWVNRDLDLYNQENHVNMAKSQIMAMRSRVNEIDTHLRDARSIT